jgi:hypothetical protein
MVARLQPTYRRGARIHCRGLGNLRGVIKELDRLYAGLGEHLEEETAFVIDGAIHETAYSRPIRPGCQGLFIPKIEEIGAALPVLQCEAFVLQAGHSSPPIRVSLLLYSRRLAKACRLSESNSACLSAARVRSLMKLY